MWARAVPDDRWPPKPLPAYEPWNGPGFRGPTRFVDAAPTETDAVYVFGELLLALGPFLLVVVVAALAVVFLRRARTAGRTYS